MSRAVRLSKVSHWSCPAPFSACTPEFSNKVQQLFQEGPGGNKEQSSSAALPEVLPRLLTCSSTTRPFLCQPSSHLVGFHSLHEEIRDPEGKEQVPGSLLFFPSVLLQVQELKDVQVPWLQVDGKSPRSLGHGTQPGSEQTVLGKKPPALLLSAHNTPNQLGTRGQHQGNTRYQHKGRNALFDHAPPTTTPSAP